MSGPVPAGVRRQFGLAVSAGVAGAVVSAVASGQPWMTIADPLAYDESMPGAVLAGVGTVGEVPLARAVSLVLVACWGVLLVTRGPVRRVIALLAVLASATLAGSLGWAVSNLPDHVQEAAQARVTASAQVADQQPSWTWWVFLAAAGASLALVASVLAALKVGSWPEMGRRYDAPQAMTESAVVREGADNPAEWWKAIGEGRDPTA